MDAKVIDHREAKEHELKEGMYTSNDNLPV